MEMIRSAAETRLNED